MSERDEPSIDPQPGELGDGEVNVRGGTELAGGRATGSGAGWGTTGTEGGGGIAGPHAGEEDVEDPTAGDADPDEPRAGEL